jgi:hypothetical protein
VKRLDPSYLGLTALPPFLFIDTNIFVLYVVGVTNRSRISAERATKTFTVEDFELLVAVMANFRKVRVTPNVLTEAGNLLDRTREIFRSQVRETLAEILPDLKERYVPSIAATRIDQYGRIGLADAATMQASRNRCLVLTDDLGLYLALQEAGTPSINFNHVRIL